MPKLEVQVGPCGQGSRLTDDGDGFAGFDEVTFFFQKGGVVLIGREIVIFVLNTNSVAIVGGPRREDDGAVEGGFDHLVFFGGDIDAEVSVLWVVGLCDDSCQRGEEVGDSEMVSVD